MVYRQIEKIIGSIGDIKAESNAILLEYDLDVTPYSLDVTKELPSSDYSLTENDIKDREDWKDECIFTIDPDTAVDLDDSVSCKPLENGNYEVITLFYRVISREYTSFVCLFVYMYMCIYIYILLFLDWCAYIRCYSLCRILISIGYSGFKTSYNYIYGR